MKPTLSFLASLVVAAAAATAAHADNPFFPSMPQAPDACGPGYYCTNRCGACYGPNYCLRPCFPPFNGLYPVVPRQPCNQGLPVPQFMTATFPTHPYARSPRDYFMAE